eukprot:6905646-Heterocapsa_arctica.AAC.1
MASPASFLINVNSGNVSRRPGPAGAIRSRRAASLISGVKESCRDRSSAAMLCSRSSAGSW